MRLLREEGIGRRASQFPATLSPHSIAITLKRTIDDNVSTTVTVTRPPPMQLASISDTSKRRSVTRNRTRGSVANLT